MSNFLSTTTFSILVATSWFFIFLTAFPLFVQFVLVSDFNLRLWDVVIGGFPYLIASAAFVVCWIQRRYMLSYRVERIPRRTIVLKQGDAPNGVIDLVHTEYRRVSAIAYHSRPTDGFQLGWGRPGTKYEGIYFKRAFCDAVERLDTTARKLLPSLPALCPTTRLTSHFHPLSIVIPIDSTALKDADVLFQIATFAVDNDNSSDNLLGAQNAPYGRYGHVPKEERNDGEINEEEFERGMEAVGELQSIFEREIEYLGSDLSTISDSRSRRSYNRSAKSPHEYPRGMQDPADSDEAERLTFRRGDSQSDIYGRGEQEFQFRVRAPDEEPMDGSFEGDYRDERDGVAHWRNTRRSGSPSVRSFIHAPP